MHACAVEICLYKVHLYHAWLFQSCYVLVYILFVFLFSLPSQTSSWISHLSFQMAFAAIWNLNFELGSTRKWKVSQYMQLGKITVEWEETLQNICSVDFFLSTENHPEFSPSRRIRCSYLSFLNNLPLRAGTVSDIFMSVCWISHYSLETAETRIAQKTLKAAKAEPTQRDILQLYANPEAAAFENVLLKMAWEIILVIKGSCTKGNGRFYKGWTKM